MCWRGLPTKPQGSPRLRPVGCDGQPGIAGGVLVLAGHRFVPFNKTPVLVCHPDWLYPGDTLRNLGPMMHRNPPKALTPLNRDTERAADDRHGDHQPPHGEPGSEAG
jgi:hypothetical protein